MWEYRDDRGCTAVLAYQPERVVAYVQAGATLWDLGVRPEGLFGSQHDGPGPDPAKTGAIPAGALPYFGSGADLDTESLIAAGTDLVVAVTYDDTDVYGLPPDVARGLEDKIPLVALSVGQKRSLESMRERFEALAASLGAATATATATAPEASPPEASSPALRLAAAEDELRRAATAAPGVRVVALSGAGPDTAYVARPQSWPDLRALSGLGVRMVAPADGPGLNWATVGWHEVGELRPDVVLLDARGNAANREDLASVDAWRAVEAGARVVPWNPEAPCSSLAHAGLFAGVAKAHDA